MNEKKYEKKIEFQNKLISRQSEQIESLKLQIETLRMECAEKDRIIDSVEPMRKELAEHVTEVKKRKKEFESLVNELKNMKKIMNQEFFRGRWWLVKHVIGLGK
jgi:predicted RNase H-like nuclease (RuvC/YqgF family)